MSKDENYVLSLNNVSKSFGGVQAVSGVSMDVARGERQLILGTNGAGKSTLFNLICGDLPVSEGSITLFGEDVTKKNMRVRARMGVRRTYQATALFTNLTVRQNFYLALLGEQPERRHFRMFANYKDTAEYNDRIEEMARKVRIEDKLDETCDNLSHGEHRQLELGLALIVNPRLVLLDEPSSGLSETERQIIKGLISDMDQSITLVIIEHNMELAFAVATHVIVMENGRVVCVGSPEEVQSDEYVKTIYLGKGAGK